MGLPDDESWKVPYVGIGGVSDLPDGDGGAVNIWEEQAQTNYVYTSWTTFFQRQL